MCTKNMMIILGVVAMNNREREDSLKRVSIWK